MALRLNWNGWQGNDWCNLLTVSLDQKQFKYMDGVYIIWRGGQTPKVLRVGQGFIKDRLHAHRNAPEMLRYKPYGLFVTWASVPQNHQDGVERFLSETLKPEVGSRYPNASPIEVNMPW
ncbi:MAG: hypothetical protein K8T10_07150 [Candidatus Eremiobacteraeota bacterium]|nr:hypothetical protein [Candidatus Eremiobacteraeota bacterium]